MIPQEKKLKIADVLCAKAIRSDDDGWLTAKLKGKSKITPSVIAEVSGIISEYHPENNAFLAAKLIIPESQVFDFGEMSHDSIYDNAERGIEYFKEGFLRLPYPNVFFQAQLKHLDNSDNSKNGLKSHKIYVCASEIDINDIAVSLFIETKVKESGGYSREFLPVAFFNFSAHGKDAEQMIYEFMSLEKSEFCSDYFSDRLIKEAVKIILSGCMILNTKGMPVTQKKNPLLLKGMPNSNDNITYIDCVLYEKLAKEPPPSSKGKAKRPKPHLRRGHIRNLPDGNKTWVRDTLVNFKLTNGVDATSLFSRERYIITSANEKLSAPKNIPVKKKEKTKSFLSRLKKLFSF